MGVKIVGGTFTASVISLVKHGVKQVFWRASFVAITFTSRSGSHLLDLLILEREEGNNHDKK